MYARDAPSSGAIGLDDSFREDGGFPRQHSSSSLHTMVSSGSSTAGVVMSTSKVYAMRRSIGEHVDAVARTLLTSKEPSDKRRQIESALRVCKEAFFELSTVYLCLIEERKRDASYGDLVRDAVTQAFSQFREDVSRENIVCEDFVSDRSYASAVRASGTDIKVARGQTIPVKRSTNILVLPKKESQDKFATSKDTKETFQKLVKPSDFNLKISRITPARNKGVRIEAVSGDITGLKGLKELDRAGLEIEHIAKVKPRLIIHDVPAGMTKDDLRSELIALNLDKNTDQDVNVVYIFPPKKNRSFVSCVIEVSPQIRTKLLNGTHVFINYSACRLADYVRVLQCYRCLAFGHLSLNCTASPLCGHCAGSHEMRNCQNRNASAMCGNCKRWHHEELPHSALDGNTCPILRKRLQDKIRNINYG